MEQSPKEKAKELVDKYFLTIVDDSWLDYYKIAKQCALIAVEEILKTNPYGWDGEDLNSTIDYWQEVKKEIEKL